LISISASLAACRCCFLNACANVHCVNASVYFEANKYNSSSNICEVRWDFYYPLNYKFTKESSSEFFLIGSDLTELCL